METLRCLLALLCVFLAGAQNTGSKFAGKFIEKASDFVRPLISCFLYDYEVASKRVYQRFSGPLSLRILCWMFPASPDVRRLCSRTPPGASVALKMVLQKT